MSTPTILCNNWGLSWEAISGISNNLEREIIIENNDIVAPLDYYSLKTENDINGTSLSYGKKSDMPEFIFGLTNDENYLALNVDFSHTWSSSGKGLIEHIHGNALLISDSQFNPSSLVELISVHIPELENWIANYFFWINESESNDIRSRYKRVDEFEYIILLDTKDLQVSIKRYIGDCLTIPTCEMQRFSILIRPKIQTECKEISERYILPLLSFFTFCFGTKARLDSVYLKLERRKGWVQLLSANTVSYYVSGDDGSSRYACFSLSQVMKANLNFLKPWFEERSDLFTAISLIIPLLEEKHQEPLFQFMVASSALEAIERHVISQEIEPQKAFRQRVKRIVEAAETEFLDDIGEKLKDRLQNGNQKGQKQNHRELVEKYNRLSAWFFSDPAVFVKLQVANRNSVFHANASNQKLILNPNDMRIHAHALVMFCYGLIAAVLGISEDIIIDSLKNGRYMWATQSAYEHLCELYSK